MDRMDRSPDDCDVKLEKPLTDDGLSLKKHDPSAWTRAYDRHERGIYGFIAHLAHGDRALAEELHQQTWLSALSNINLFDPTRGEFRQWLFGIARREVALHYRRQSEGAGGGSGVIDSKGEGEAFEGAILPEDVAERLERASVVRAALAELGTDARCVLLQKYVEDRSVREIAERIGKSEKAVESLLTRSRVRLRALLRWYFPQSGHRTR